MELPPSGRPERFVVRLHGAEGWEWPPYKRGAEFMVPVAGLYSVSQVVNPDPEWDMENGGKLLPQLEWIGRPFEAKEDDLLRWENYIPFHRDPATLTS